MLMGMAATQARYLALSARKTNTEYEGQQLNQQRLNLSNQSADLFNQMLTMSVPICPDSTDFTTLQYSFSDGVNISVISDYYRLGTPQEDYNYVVTSYHYEDIYTGASKKMNDPQLQNLKTNNFTNNPDTEYKVLNAIYKPESKPGSGDDTYTFSVERNGVESTRTFKRVGTLDDPDAVETVDAIYNRTTSTKAGSIKSNFTAAGDVPLVWDAGTSSWIPDADPAAVAATKDQWRFTDDITIKVQNPAYDATKPEDTDGDGDIDNPRFIESTIAAGRAFTALDLDNNPELKQAVTQSYGAKYDNNDTYFAVGFDVDGNAVAADDAAAVSFAFVSGNELNAVKDAQGDIATVDVRGSDSNVYFTDGKYYVSAAELSNLVLEADNPADIKDTILFHSTENDPTFSNFTNIGNSELTELTLDDWNDPDQENTVTELKQVIKDMKAVDPTAYSNLSKCFDPETGEYLGGIFKFKMAGKTYYTTLSDMQSAAEGAFKKEVANNGIDAQNKLKYYHAFYQKTKVEEVKQALLETDGNGRFKSVKFDDDSAVYTLNCEAITDEDAYNDAMNKYRYQQEQYDNEVAKINAKTEIIQAQDRQLQLRLQQLNTEQSALQTEMEACQKVVSKNVEMSFKTFGG